jgi:hypothetical protein
MQLSHASEYVAGVASGSALKQKPASVRVEVEGRALIIVTGAGGTKLAALPDGPRGVDEPPLLVRSVERRSSDIGDRVDSVACDEGGKGRRKADGSSPL